MKTKQFKNKQEKGEVVICENAKMHKIEKLVGIDWLLKSNMENNKLSQIYASLFLFLNTGYTEKIDKSYKYTMKKQAIC